ncbi:MAG: zinc ribbon domain-containing protein, partial [Chloroflexota bacterium]|nr:zinc ribbon domain-containing protein [Chloroflexota bacterium]
MAMRTKGMAIYCPNCGVELPDGVAFCDACGTPIRAQGSAPPAPQANNNPLGSMGAVACPVCGAAAMPGEAFCDNCGAALLAPSSYSPSSPPTQSVPPLPSYSSAPMSGGGAYSAPPPAPSRQLIASLVVSSPPPPATISIPDRAELIVGRSDPQSNSYPDLDLGPYGGLDLGVSRRHFRLKRDGEQFYIEDLGSMNGTVVNGHRLPPN